MTNAGLPGASRLHDFDRGLRHLLSREGEDSRRHRQRRSSRTSRKLEKAAGAPLGSTDNPLLVSVRSGAKFSMPGMMDTILNLGLNDDAVEGLKRRTQNGRFAFDSYRRFMQMFGNVVLEIPKDVVRARVRRRQESRRGSRSIPSSTKRAPRGRRRYKGVVQKRSGKPFPQNPADQLKMARDAVFRSWMNPRAQGVPSHLRHP